MSDFLDSKGKCKVLHTQDSSGTPCWKCTRNLDTMLYPESQRHCFFVGCPGISEPEPVMFEEGTEVVVAAVPKESAADSNLCRRCGEKPISPNRKLYCSDVCRKRASRTAYRKRKLVESQPL